MRKLSILCALALGAVALAEAAPHYVAITWNGGASYALLDAGATQTSDPFATVEQTVGTITPLCSVTTIQPTNASPSCVLQGSNTGGDPWVTPPLTAFVYSALDGGSADGGWSAQQWGYAYGRIVCTSNADGGEITGCGSFVK